MEPKHVINLPGNTNGEYASCMYIALLLFFAES